MSIFPQDAKEIVLIEKEREYEAAAAAVREKEREQEAMAAARRRGSSAAASPLPPHGAPIPLVSAVSRDASEDFELTPLRDRMRAFQVRKICHKNEEIFLIYGIYVLLIGGHQPRFEARRFHLQDGLARRRRRGARKPAFV